MAERPAEETVGLAVEWLEERGDRPFFVWVHVQDPHGPYDPPAPFRGQIGDVPLRVKRPLAVLDHFSGRAGIPSYQALGELRDPAAYAGLYAEEILYTDHWVGRLLDAVDGLGRDRGTVVLLTADHGESMGEDGWFFQHGQSTTPDLARVPFIVRAPGVAPRRISQPVSHVDVAPTLAELAGLEALEVSGVSLAPLLLSGGSLDERVIFSDTEGEAGVYTARGHVRARGSATAIKPPAELEPLRFQAAAPNDEGEWRPADVAPADRELLTRYIEARVPPVAAGVMEPDHIEQLRALGYLEDDPAELESRPETAPTGGGER
jgi:arylsulfatase A-like enzyme